MRGHRGAYSENAGRGDREPTGRVPRCGAGEDIPRNGVMTIVTLRLRERERKICDISMLFRRGNGIATNL